MKRAPDKGARRLLVVVAVSVAVHAAALPLAYHLLVAADSASPGLSPLQANVEEERRSEMPANPVIVEPPQLLSPKLPAARELPPLPELPDLQRQWELPSAAPVVRLPAVARSGLSTSPERHTGRDRSLGAAAGTACGEGDGGDAAAQDGADSGPPPLPRPSAPTWPDDPPASLYAGLPSGGLRTLDLEPLFEADSREQMVRKVYSLSRYPQEALEAESEGTVTVRFRIDRNGHACDVEALAGTDGLHPSLSEEAVRMVKAGAPYPLPTLRNTVDLFVAVAWRNTPEARGDRIVVVMPSGDHSVDDKARALAAADAAREGLPGWHLSAWSVKAVADMSAGERVERVRFVSFEGDERLRSTVEKAVAARMEQVDRTGYLRIPIRFHIRPN